MSTELIPTLPIQALWPSFIISGLMIVAWADYCYGALRAYGITQRRGVWREFVVSFVMLLVTLMLSFGIVAAWTPPPLYIDVPLVTALAGLRTILLIVGVWLVWDRRKRPEGYS